MESEDKNDAADVNADILADVFEQESCEHAHGTDKQSCYHQRPAAKSEKKNSAKASTNKAG